MGLVDLVKAVRDRDKPHPDELSPFADEEFDEVAQSDGDDSVVPLMRERADDGSA